MGWIVARTLKSGGRGNPYIYFYAYIKKPRIFRRDKPSHKYFTTYRSMHKNTDTDGRHRY
jgi:hypothetical protein